ncbi:MAG: hypothetical protein KDI90_05690 [Alphaproteobacteria bacterium]|nr:hypothetical protein [Alphaproteobacteria bacterium]MCB9974319.1 hypothetical protein [Rhodospirillales bacterium]
MKERALSFYFGVFLISGMVMALQVMQSRIFSVTSWYHLSFLVISLAMFGLTLGALKIYRGSEEEFRKNYSVLARNHMVAFAFFIIIGLFAQLYIPLVSEDNWRTFIHLPIVAVATSAAYYHAGVVITAALTRSPYPIGRVYGIDLLGAGLGCLFVLFIMETIDSPSGIVFLSAIAFLGALTFPVPKDSPGRKFNFGGKSYDVKKLAVTMAFVVAGIGFLNIALPRPLIYPINLKTMTVTQKDIDYDAWNSISRVTVTNEYKDVSPFLWGPSPLLKTDEYKGKFKVDRRQLVIDGDASTPITYFDGDFSKHGYLEYDVTNIAYTTPGIEKSAIIGVGGGRDLMSARYFGVKEIYAMDVNPVQVRLLTTEPYFAKHTGLGELPGVKIFNQEARSWFRQNRIKFDTIQMSLIDTWAATGAGAFALSENGLYTVEAWTIFISNLSDHGLFTVSRWAMDTEHEFTRTLSVAMASLFGMGVEDPTKHIAIFHAGRISTIIVSRSPMTQEQIEAMRKTATDKQFDIVMLPGYAVPGGALGQISQAKSVKDINLVSDTLPMDVTPSTDMRPFFFNQARMSNPLEVMRMALTVESQYNVLYAGQAKALFNLFIIIGFSLLMVVFVIIMPLLKTVKDKGNLFIKAGTLYFVLIGLGFMLIEISFLQALGVFLGHPIYGLSIVLFSLILSAGVGSLISERVPLNGLGRQVVWSVLTCAYAVMISFNMTTLFDIYAEVDLLTRILVSVAMIFPAGILMGFAFPTGLTLTEKFDTRATAWFWGINGAAGILGSTVGIALNMAIGIDKTMILGGACYALLSLCFLGLNAAEKNKADLAR